MIHHDLILCNVLNHNVFSLENVPYRFSLFLEYSIMTSATEMIYMPMGHEHRYLGKELIRFFGHRMGKSGN